MNRFRTMDGALEQAITIPTIGESLFKQEKEKTEHVSGSLYCKTKEYDQNKMYYEFGLYQVDDASGRIRGTALYYAHRSGATVMIVDHSVPRHDVVKITGTANARLEAHRDVSRFAESVHLPIIEVLREERWMYRP